MIYIFLMLVVFVIGMLWVGHKRHQYDQTVIIALKTLLDDTMVPIRDVRIQLYYQYNLKVSLLRLYHILNTTPEFVIENCKCCYTDKVYIRVDWNDIREGERVSCERCPVARAIERKMGIKCHVGRDQVETLDGRSWSIPSEISNFIFAFDRGDKVSPISFHLTRLFREPVHVHSGST